MYLFEHEAPFRSNFADAANGLDAPIFGSQALLPSLSKNLSLPTSNWDQDDVFERNSLLQEEFDHPDAENYELYFSKGRRDHHDFFC